MNKQAMSKRVATRTFLAKIRRVNWRDWIENIWYEDDNGNRVPKEQASLYIVQHPSILVRKYMKMLRDEDIAACPHPPDKVHINWSADLIEPYEERKCSACGGYQIHKKGEPWPEKWEHHPMVDLMEMSSTWDPNLVLAMSRPSNDEIAKQKEHIGKPALVWSVPAAITIAAGSCERCLNALLWTYGLTGYPKDSEDWNKAGTTCKLCEPGSDFWTYVLGD